MHYRNAELAAFLKSLHTAIADRAQADSDALQVTGKIMQALQVEQPAALPEPAWLPVCGLIEEAVENVAAKVAEDNPARQMSFSSSLVDHVQALHALAPQLAWWHRTDGVQPGSLFATSHANATVIGKGGLEERDDVWVGISLMAPDIQYPVHHHPPEEVYLVLSRGYWQKGGGEWFEPGIGGLVHNTPDILHAMRSGSVPLLASWCLWRDHA